MRFSIAVLPGDGIGKEIIEAGINVLKSAEEIVSGFELDFAHYDAGAELYQRTGTGLPEATFKACRSSDAIYLGAIGLPDVREFPGGPEVGGQVMFKLRFDLDLFAGVRPIKLYRGIDSPLRNVENIDFVVLRENIEGLFASYGGGTLVSDEVATDTMVITRKGTEKIVDIGFQLALKRNGRLLDHKRVVTCTDKSNVFRSMAFFNKVFHDVADRYEGQVERDHVLIDAMTLLMVQQPQNYDIIVTENQFGDIISDLAAALVGGMGMAPSGDIGYQHAMFQPAHGSAPTIAGKGIANPLATILSGSMMLDWLSDQHNCPAAKKAGELIEQAVARTVKRGVKTVDIGGTSTTAEVAEAIIAQMKTQAQLL